MYSSSTRYARGERMTAWLHRALRQVEVWKVCPMELTAAEFARLLKDLKCDVRQGERRDKPRAPMRAKVFIIPVVLGGKTPTRRSVWAKDISRTGMGISSSLKFDEGSRMLIILPVSQCESFVLLAEVVRSVRMPGNTYVSGCRLVRRVTMEEYDGFLAGLSDTIVTLTTAA